MTGTFGRRHAWVLLFLGIAASAAGDLTLSLTRVIDGGATYMPGETLDATVQLDLSGDGTLTALGLEETLPDAWT